MHRTRLNLLRPFRNGHTTRVLLLALGNLLLPSINQQEAPPPPPSLACWSTGPRATTKMRLGASAESSRPRRYLPLWSEPVVVVRRRSVEWRRRDAPPVPRSSKGWMRSSSSSSRAATRPPASMATLRLLPPAAPVRVFQHPLLTSASPPPLA